jgi:branched-chain amino acid transport system substrate-binding protein
MRDHVPAGLDGVCLPSTFTPNDHRGTTTVMLYQNVSTEGKVSAEKLDTIKIPLRPDWLGW